MYDWVQSSKQHNKTELPGVILMYLNDNYTLATRYTLTQIGVSLIILFNCDSAVYNNVYVCCVSVSICQTDRQTGNILNL